MRKNKEMCMNVSTNKTESYTQRVWIHFVIKYESGYKIIIWDLFVFQIIKFQIYAVQS